MKLLYKLVSTLTSPTTGLVRILHPFPFFFLLCEWFRFGELHLGWEKKSVEFSPTEVKAVLSVTAPTGQDHIGPSGVTFSEEVISEWERPSCLLLSSARLAVIPDTGRHASLGAGAYSAGEGWHRGRRRVSCIGIGLKSLLGTLKLNCGLGMRQTIRHKWLKNMSYRIIHLFIDTIPV